MLIEEVLVIGFSETFLKYLPEFLELLGFMLEVFRVVLPGLESHRLEPHAEEGIGFLLLTFGLLSFQHSNIPEGLHINSHYLCSKLLSLVVQLSSHLLFEFLQIVNGSLLLGDVGREGVLHCRVEHVIEINTTLWIMNDLHLEDQLRGLRPLRGVVDILKALPEGKRELLEE